MNEPSPPIPPVAEPPCEYGARCTPDDPCGLHEAQAAPPIPPVASHDWYVEDVPQGMVPRILCRNCPAEKPRDASRSVARRLERSAQTMAEAMERERRDPPDEDYQQGAS